MFTHKHIFFCLALLLVLVFMGYRAQFGVDFTDESFYLAMSYNFHLGARPFVEEINLVLFSAWFVSPLWSVYGKWLPDYQGAVLFFRCAYIAFQLTVALIIYRRLLRFESAGVATLLALTPAVFVPFNIFAFSYNTVGASTFVLGAVLLACSLLSGMRRDAMLSGGVHAFTVLAYPSMVVPIVAVAAILFWQERKRRANLLSGYFAAFCVTIVLLFVPVFEKAGIENLIYSYRYTSSFGMQRLSNLGRVVSGVFSHWYLILIWTIGFAWSRRHLPGLSKLLILSFPLIWLYVGGVGMPHANWYVVNYGLSAPIVYWFLRNDRFAGDLMRYLWLPAFAVGMMSAWSSSNAGIAAANGLIAGCIVTSWLLVMLYRKTAYRTWMNETAAYEALSPMIFAAILILFQFHSVYRDPALPHLSETVQNGVYAFLHTSPEKVEFIKQLTADMGEVKQRMGGKSLLSFCDFPVAYFFGEVRPSTNTAWIFPANFFKSDTVRRDLVDRYKAQNAFPELVVKLNKMPYDENGQKNYTHSLNDPLVQMVESPRYLLVTDRKEYQIFALKKAKD